jgi:uncharacterized Zn-finger protein
MSSTKSQDIVWTDNSTVGCHGDSQNGLGHPLVYYTVTKERQAVCGYCGRIFRLKEKKENVASIEDSLDRG